MVTENSSEKNLERVVYRFMRLAVNISHLIFCVSRYFIDKIVVESCRRNSGRGKDLECQEKE